MRRIESDVTGRRAILSTGALGSAGLSLLWACSLIGLRLLDRELFARTLGIGAVPARYEKSEAPTLDDFRILRMRPDVLLTCQRLMTLTDAGGHTVPVTVVATSPAYFRFRGGRLQQGRLLTWDDTAVVMPRVVLAAPVASLIRSDVYLDGERQAVVGILAPQVGAGEDFTIVRLLRIEDLPTACIDAGRRAISIMADPPLVTLASKQIAAFLDARRALPAGSTRLITATSPRESSLWVQTHRATKAMLLGASGLVAAVAALTMGLLLEVRNRGRRSELAICRALGATRRDLAVELLFEACALTAIALLLGLLPATGVAWLVAAATDVRPPLAVIALGTASVLASVMVASAGWATRVAVREPPISAIGLDRW